VLKWEPPRTIKEIRSFLGLAGYYRWFIEGFSKIVKPLTSLLEKDREFKWTDACQDSFEELKRRLTTSPVLVMPDLQKGFISIVMRIDKVWVVFLCRRDML
jgi:hypothetical protein